jgi:hypothetical protein
MELPPLWQRGDVTALIFARSFGCPFCQEMATQVARDILPEVRSDGNKLFLVSIGSQDTGSKFAAKTQFPAELLFGDEENATYDALGLNQGLGVTYISPLVCAQPPHARCCHRACVLFQAPPKACIDEANARFTSTPRIC